MLSLHPLTLAAPAQHLQQLNVIRSLLLTCLWAALLFSIHAIEIQFAPILWVLAGLTLITALTFFRLKNALVVTEIEFFSQLLLDVIGLNCLFYFSGGASNPFMSYLLVPVCISAATLPSRYTWIIAAISLIAYTLLLFFYIQFPLFAVDHEHHNSRFNWHILGMWFNFFVSSILITYFVVKMAATLRQQHETLSRLREDELRNEQLMAVAMLAAGAAHEINTPLSTMTVLLSELRHEYQHNEKLHSDLALLSQQVGQCSATLKRMVKDSSSATRGEFKPQSITDFCESILDRWKLMRPGIQYKLQYSGTALDKIIRVDPRLDQAIINLLNNAADASPMNVTIAIECDDNGLQWKISDAGDGIAPHNHPLGLKSFSTKESGLGLGLVITHATINSYGGEVIQTANSPKGTVTQIILPLRSN